MLGALGLPPRGLLERIGLRLNLVPVPAAEAFFNMMSARTLMAAESLGIFEELAAGARTVEEIAERRSLDARGVRALLDALASVGYAARDGERWSLSARARPWLDDGSPTSVEACLAFNYQQWDWWSALERVLRTGRALDIHARDPDDPRWEPYIVAMFQLARLSAPEVARKVRVPRGASRLLDLGGAHGWFAAEIARRHPRLEATVLDLPGSARVGRRLLAAAGVERVRHVEGDFLQGELGGAWDVVLAFQVAHHLERDALRDLLARVRRALRPGGTLAVLDCFREPKPAPAAALLGLHYYLTSNADTWERGDLESELRRAGFRYVRWKRLRHIPVQALCLSQT